MVSHQATNQEVYTQRLAEVQALIIDVERSLDESRCTHNIAETGVEGEKPSAHPLGTGHAELFHASEGECDDSHLVEWENVQALYQKLIEQPTCEGMKGSASDVPKPNDAASVLSVVKYKLLAMREKGEKQTAMTLTDSKQVIQSLEKVKQMTAALVRHHELVEAKESERVQNLLNIMTGG